VRDALALTVVVALQLGGALLEPFDKRFVGFSASDVGASTEVVAESLPQHGDFLGETAGPLFRVGELDLCSVASERAGSARPDCCRPGAADPEQSRCG
jgi:hypothetical protein